MKRSFGKYEYNSSHEFEKILCNRYLRSSCFRWGFVSRRREGVHSCCWYIRMRKNNTHEYIRGGLDVPDSGALWIKNTSLKDLSKEQRTIFRRRNIGFVFQQYNLIPSLNIRENIVLPLRLDGREIDLDFFEEIVAILGLQDKLDRFPPTLSGGQQQRAAIARALLMKPAIVLADEPTGNLDSVTSMEVVALLKSCAFRFHQTVLVVTHQEEVAQMADRIIRMSDGKICVTNSIDC